MRTVKEVSALTGVSVRALHHYDRIGLLPPTKITKAGYRLYDDTALLRLQYILLFKEMEFPLKKIRELLNGPATAQKLALEQQITLLEMKKEHLENLLAFARGIQTIGVKNLDFSAFDTKKIDEYARQARESYGKTPEYLEYKEKAAGRSREEERRLSIEMMGILAQFGQMKDLDPASEPVQQQVEKLQNHITAHYYTCSKEILACLGRMYEGGGSMTENIDHAGGEGTAAYAQRAIEIYCGQ